MYLLNKFSLIITTRCNLKCKYCCEYVPQHKPFADMIVEEADVLLTSIFKIFDRIRTFHLTGGGEPFLHPQLAELIELSMKYADKFDRLMLFTNSVTSIKEDALALLAKYHDKIIVQVSLYGINPEREQKIVKLLQENNVNCKIEKYYGEDQSFGGWVDFGKWESYNRSADELDKVFHECAVTRVMNGNWRTRDGKVHWCSRSQRGMELGLIPDSPSDYVDLFDDTSPEEKREKFTQIANARYISACNHCSGDQGTEVKSKRLAAAEQL